MVQVRLFRITAAAMAALVVIALAAKPSVAATTQLRPNSSSRTIQDNTSSRRKLQGIPEFEVPTFGAVPNVGILSIVGYAASIVVGIILVVLWATS